jgi:dipeptidyl aminopeptidase/acylaminoacyl peptidase
MNTAIARSLMVAAVCAGSFARAAEPPPATAFARLPATAMVRLSPNGQTVAWADLSGDRTLIAIFSLASMDYLRQFHADDEGKVKLRSIDWAGNDTVLLTVSVTETGPNNTDRDTNEFFRILALDAAGGEARVMLLDDGLKRFVTGAHLVQTQSARPGVIVMSSFDFLSTAYRQETGSRLTGGRKDSGWGHSLFEVDTQNGNGKRIEGGTSFTDTWIVDREGRAVARSEWNSVKREYQILAKHGGGWKAVHSADHWEDLRPEGISMDGQAIVAVGARGGERDRAWRIPLDGSEITALGDDAEEVEFAIKDRVTGAVAGIQLGGLSPSIRWLDPRLDNIHKAVAKAFPGQQTVIYDRSSDYSRVLARVETAASSPIYYLIDLKRGTADMIGEAYPELVGVTLGERQETSYRARDGFEIPAYLTLPPGRKPQHLPLVVFPHGGPYSRDDSGFDWWTQFMATRGYAVLQPQFRGSTGFGTRLRKAGEREWGQAMQDDLVDGVAALVQQGIADPALVCVVGASYGGYAALSGAAFNPDQFACAASVNAITDLPSMYGYIRNRFGDESDSLAEWKRLVGRPYADELAKYSPARAVESIRVPLLLIHGTNDTVVPYAQAENFAKAMKAGNKAHQLVRLENEDHWLTAGTSRLRLLQELERYLHEHLSPNAPAE